MTTLNHRHLKNYLLSLTVATVLVAASSCEKDKGKAKPVPDYVALDTVTTNWDAPTIKDLISLLGRSIDSLPEIKKCEKREKKIEVGDEYDENGYDDIYWFIVEYLYQDKLQMTVESDWVNKDTVERIALYSNEIIKGMEEADIGQPFGNIRNLKGRTLSTPDGVLFVKLYKYPEISIQLDISHIPYGESLYFGVAFPDIPDSLKIYSIVIMDRSQND